MPANRGFHVEKSKSRDLLVEAADNLLAEEGYHAISARRVAERAGLKPQLVHYYFRSMDDLMIAVYHKATDHYMTLHEQALQSPQPLRALWTLNNHRSDTKRSMEFIAAGTHRESLRAVILEAGEKFRALQIQAVESAVAKGGVDVGPFTPAGIAMLLAAVARTLVMENQLGITLAHKELKALIEYLLDRLEPVAGSAEPTKPPE